MLKALLSRLASLGQAHHWKYWECRDVTNLPPDACPSVSFHAHTLDLSTGEQALFRGLKSSVRTAVRKAEQAGVQVETSTSLQSLQTFYDLHCKTRRKHGLPPQPFRFFRALHRHVLSQGFGRVLIATTGQIPVAANVYFHWQKKAIYKYGASDHAGQELRASNLLMWRAIQGYASQGFHSLHLGRTSINTQSEGLRRFKLGWGTKEERINYLRYDCQQDRYVVCKDEAFGWYNSLMTRMPILFLRILGSLLYRHVG